MSFDAVVVGAGPNGLVAAAHLAKTGARVLVLEATPHAGGAVRSVPLGDGFVVDVGAAFFPFASVSPALVPLELHRYGLALCHAPIDSAHPSVDGTVGIISRDWDRVARAMGDDGARWVELLRWFSKGIPETLRALLGPFPPMPADALAMGVDVGLTLAGIAPLSGRQLGARFATDAARRIAPGLGLHADVGPDDPGGATVGAMLAFLAGNSGFPVTRGGAGAITTALLALLAEHGTEVRTGTRAERIVVRGGRAEAVVTDGGDEIPAKVVLADTSAPALYLRLLDGCPEVSEKVRVKMRRYPYAWGTFKVDYALSSAVPFAIPACREAAVVHAGDSVDDLARFTREARDGALPDRPYLVVGQPSLCDPSRAPVGKATLYVYTHVPSEPRGGWAGQAEAYADVVDARIESLAPGFRRTIEARRVSTPRDLEAMNENLVGGDLGGGTAQLSNQLLFRPCFPWSGHRTPIANLFLASAFGHPGTGVHGACGWNAARAALRVLA